MVKEKKKSILLTLVLALVFVLSLSVLAGCSNNPTTAQDPKVTFMMRENGTGDWQSVETKTAKNGKVELPELTNIPQGYSFRGWFIDEACENAFDENSVSKDVTVYAFLSNKILTVNIKTVDEDIKLTDKSIADLTTIEEEHKSLAENKSLTFDGWYTNAECTTKFNADSDTTEVYARYAAAVTYTNGYEIDNIVKYVLPGSSIVKPEIADIKKDYMDEEGISFVDSEGVAFDFKNSVINKNTVITILWQTPGLDILPIEGTEYYKINGFRSDFVTGSKPLMESFKVLSIPGKIVKGTKTYDITTVTASNLYLATSAEKIIFNDGIKFVQNLNGGINGNAPIKEIIMPDSLRVIESSLKNMGNIESIKLNEGLEAIINCFSLNENNGYVPVIPSTVKNMSRVPAKLDLSKNTRFSIDHDRLYMQDEVLGKVLITDSSSNVDSNKALVIPADVEAIQVAAFDGINYDYLRLPASFKAVSYNMVKTPEMAWYTGNSLLTDETLVQPENNPTTDKLMSTKAYAVVDNLNDIKYVTIDAIAFPEGVNPYAFTEHMTKYDELERLKVVLIGTVSEGQVQVTITTTNKMTGEVQEFVITKDFGTTITQEEINAKISLSEIQKIETQKEFGIDFDLAQTMDKNHYIDISIIIDAEGYNYEVVGEEVAITGFNQETAKNIALEGEDAKYLVYIPNVIEGKPVTKINANAFKDVATLSQVYIGSSVKHIGDYAFANTTLLELVDITPGGLETIGEGAFEYAGAKQEEVVADQDQASGQAEGEKEYKWVVNGSLADKTLIIKLPLSKLDRTIPELDNEKFAIGERAFNSPAIKDFVDVEGDIQVITNKINTAIDAYETGKYYFYGNMNGVFGIVQYVKSEGFMGAYNNNNIMHDFNYVATAPGMKVNGVLNFGVASQGYLPGSFLAFARVTVQPGSVQIYNTGIKGIQFAQVAKIKANAITYLDESFFKIDISGEDKVSNKFGYTIDHKDSNYTSRDLIITQDSSIFEEGWCMGRPNSSNDFMQYCCLGGYAIAGMQF